MSARYWRVLCPDTLTQGDLAVTELTLYAQGVRVDSGVTATVAPASGSLSALGDGSAAGEVRWTRSQYASTGFYLTFDLGTSALVDEMRIGSPLLESESLRDCVIQKSQDGVIWGSFVNVLGVQWPGSNSIRTISGDLSGYPPTVLMNFDGADNSTVFTDSSLNNFTVSRNGSVVIRTNQFKWGSSSVYFNGGSDRLTIPTSTLFDFTDRDWTVEVWIRPGTLTGTHVIVDRGRYADYTPWMISQVGSSVALSCSVTLNAWLVSMASGPVLSLNTWHHIAATRSGNTFRLFCDGVLVASTTGSGSLANATMPLQIGRDTDSAYGFVGYMDDLRITKEYALYTGAFPVPGFQFSTILGATKLPIVRPSRKVSRIVSNSAPYMPPLLQPQGVYTSRTLKHKRLDSVGWGHITGTVKEKDTPTNAPLRRQVFCMDALTMNIVGAMWSDATTGAYSFTDLDPLRRYTVFSYDHEHVYRSVIADNLLPEPTT